mmetsp:Transcript_53260/g.88302  ORF Transcript_53260/g.88302 Transcript_53260/m.88302 type:complete len:208 (+) Transcript_53260:920-1543(+)
MSDRTGALFSCSFSFSRTTFACSDCWLSASVSCGSCCSSSAGSSFFTGRVGVSLTDGSCAGGCCGCCCWLLCSVVPVVVEVAAWACFSLFSSATRTKGCWSNSSMVIRSFSYLKMRFNKSSTGLLTIPSRFQCFNTSRSRPFTIKLKAGFEDKGAPYGGAPISIIKSITPRLHMSAARGSYDLPANTSGAIYPRLPTRLLHTNSLLG